MRRLLPLALLVAVAAPASACLWDYDTLVEEQRGLPSLEDAILGRYEVHTREYYERRRDRLEAKAAAGSLDEGEHDDLAVAHERLGDVERAIALMRLKEARWPGRYTTAANLGTFLAHAGRLEEGLALLEEAIRINPDAHFGRERYQVTAIRFAIEAARDPAYAARHMMLGPTMEVALGFELTGEYPSLPHRSLSRVLAAYPGLREDVYSGIVGMLKLGGDPRAPWHEFYYALGEVLACGGWETVWSGRERLPDAQRLAWMAFERAREAGSPRGDAIARYQRVLSPREGSPAHDYTVGRRRAEAWVDAYQAFERDLLARGEDASDPALFEPFYAAHGRPDRLVYPRRARPTDVAHWLSTPAVAYTAAMAAIVLVAALYVALRVRAGRRRAPAK